MQYAAGQACFAAESRTLEEEGDGMMEQELLDRMKEGEEAELLDDIGTGETKVKVRGYKQIAASILVGVICLLAGAAVYAVSRYPEQFQRFFYGGREGIWSGLLLNESYETENDDYRLRIEDMLVDGDVKVILISVEALNERSREELMKSDSTPSISFPSSGGGTVSLYGREEGKKYYFAEYTIRGRTCQVLYGEGIPGIPDREWLEEHGDETLTLSVRIRNSNKKVVTVRPDRNEFPEGIQFRKIEIRRMGIKVKGYSVEKTTGTDGEEPAEYFYPTVTAVMKDGRKIRLLEGNMGYEGDPVDARWAIGGGSQSSSKRPGRKNCRVERMDEFRRIFDVDEIESVIVNDVEYKLR